MQLGLHIELVLLHTQWSSSVTDGDLNSRITFLKMKTLPYGGTYTFNQSVNQFITHKAAQ